jgi:hypothetical protein
MLAIGVVVSDAVGLGFAAAMVAVAVVWFTSMLVEGRATERVYDLEDSYQTATELKRIQNDLEVARMRGELKGDVSSLRRDLEEDLL